MTLVLMMVMMAMVRMMMMSMTPTVIFSVPPKNVSRVHAFLVHAVSTQDAEVGNLTASLLIDSDVLDHEGLFLRILASLDRRACFCGSLGTEKVAANRLLPTVGLRK